MTGDGLIHWDDAMGRDVAAGPMAGRWDDLGRSAGSVTTGLRRVQVAPGMRTTPMHVHDDEEEIYVVLGGAGLLWQDGATCEVSTAVAHAFRAGEAGLTLLAHGERRPQDVVYYPRSGKVSFGGLGVMGKLQRVADYWEHEPPVD